MLGVLQSNLADRPVYFNCYPNFSVDINDPNVMDSLTLNVKTKNLNSKINTREIAIIYRVYYRLMKTHLAPKARHESTKGETMLMEANHEHTFIFVPRTIQWKDILFNNDWRFENITPPFASHSERSQIERVIQFPDGSIELKFLDNPARRSSSNRRSSWSPSTSGPSRPAPRPPSSSKTPEEADEIISVTDNSKGKVTGEQWIHPDNQVKRKWYVSSYPLKQRESFRDLWMIDMRRIGCEIEFFKWFEMTSRIENCTESLQVIINKWYTTSNKVVESITPPQEGINIPIAGTVIKASPFKEKSYKIGGILTSADIDRVVEQNNYSNQILHIISRKIEDTKPSISGRPTSASTSSSHNIETYPGFKIPEFSKEKFPKLSDTFEVTGNIIEKINAQLNNFNISVKDDNTSKKVSTLQEEPNFKSQEKSNLLQKLASSRFHNMKNYHTKPSFPDLQYEENAFLSTSSHEGRSITEWNIDGLAEHQIYNKLHEIGVAITTYKMRGSADKDAANMIIAGFTGMLKHWWDNYCTDEIKHLIVNATATETIVKMEGNTQTNVNVTKEDACATLLYHIAKHFIGEPKLFQDRSLQILSNLSCPNLDNFIHYKHAFLNKVRIKIQDRNNGNIPYGNLTYGDLVSTINVVALKLCTDIKLKHQLKKEQSSSRKELGSFCRDFGFITPLDKIKKDKREKSHRKKSRRRDDSTRPKKKKSRSKKPNDAKKDVCWTCGKTGHKANECRSKTKKKKINLLNIDEETKGKILAILDEPFSESLGTSDEYSDDEDIDLDYDSDASQSGKDCTCTEAFCTCDSTPYIRVLSDHSKEALFNVIQHINDNEARNRFLLELKNILLNTDKPKARPVIEPFSMKQIMNRSDHHPEPSISDLRHEVSSLKEEIRNIKARLCIVETDILTSHVPKRTVFHDLESNQGSSYEDLDDKIGIDLSNINNDHLLEPLVTNTGNYTSTSAAAGVTVISSIRPQNHHIPVKIVINKHFVINKIVLLDSGADRNCIVKGFNEQAISTKERPIQMNHEMMEFCKKEIDTLLQSKIIRVSKSPWSCFAFYVNKNAEKERGAPRLISEKDKYKTAFNVPFGQYEWNVMPFGLKNAPSEFQNIMNSIFNDYSYMSIVYIDDVLIFSENIDSHFKHLNAFFKIVKHNGLVVSAKKMVLFQTTIRFLGHDLYQGTYKPICRAIEFSSKFPSEIPDKTQLQRFLGSLNYVADFIPKVRQTCEPLYKRLRKNPVPWSSEQTQAVIRVKALV
ncbi:hypothetical protein KY285_005402 [Solanum tuberosum]|nr:hypothetical protein KY285_005402 [Solanum tuberosum]